MLSQVFQKHQSSQFIPVAQLESEMKAQIAVMEQTVRQMKASVDASMTMGQSFAAVSPDVRRAERTMDFVNNMTMDMVGVGFGGGSVCGSLLSVAMDICDVISPGAEDMLEEIATKGNMNAAVDAAVELRDQATANPRVQQMAQQAFEKDMERYAQQKKIQLGSVNSVSGLRERINMMSQRLENIQEARKNGVQHIEIDQNGINLPEAANNQNTLGWKNAPVGYQSARVQQGMRLAL